MRGAALPALALALLPACAEELAWHVDHETPREMDYAVNVKDVFVNNSLDVIFVIDNSPSMQQEHQDVIDNMKVYMDKFSQRTELQWKMALLSTDQTDAPYVGMGGLPPFNSNVPDPVSVFQRGVDSLGLSGHQDEKVCHNLVRHLHSDPGFLDPNVPLAVIAVTDATDQSNMSAEECRDRVLALKGGDAELFRYYGAFAADDLGCRQTDMFPSFHGSKHAKLVELTGGDYFSACEDDFGDRFADIGESIIESFQNPRIRLDAFPDVETLSVAHRGEPLPPGPEDEGGLWYFDQGTNSVVLHSLDFATSLNEDVRISYTEKLVHE